MSERITVETDINASLERVWEAYTSPEEIVEWNAASDDWHTTRAENDLTVGGTFLSRMEAKDGSAGFDFSGEYTSIKPLEHIAYVLEDGRNVVVKFSEEGGGVHVEVSFDPEHENTLSMQRSGWQSILNNFARYVEG